ncbi:MAG: tRNA guanosine(34) transglycosylase Tgt, partial [Bacteroidota bacterium]
LRPGLETLESAGGLHQFNGWDRPMLTDSGGYQIYSLSDRRKLTEEGVTFRSHIDGSSHFFSPESAIDVQRQIGADIIMALDECTPYPCEYQYAKDSLGLTQRWLERCCQRFDTTQGLYGYQQTLFPIVQGSTYKGLRIQAAEHVASLEREGNAIGGLSVGEPAEKMYETTDWVCQILPKNKPRYLMGVGTPVNLLECIALGIDMFDCVLPTRNARHGLLYTREGIINIKNLKWKNDHSPIDSGGPCSTSEFYTKSYLRHLIHSKEMLGAQISSIHNLSFFLWLVKTARTHILAGDFADWKTQMVPKLERRL